MPRSAVFSIPDSRLVVLAQTGHLPQEERPERTVEEIVTFLEGRDAGDQPR